MYIEYPSYFLFPMSKEINVNEYELMRSIENEKHKYKVILREIDEEYIKRHVR